MSKTSRLCLTMTRKNGLLIHGLVKVFIYPRPGRGGSFKVVIEAPKEIEIDRIANPNSETENVR